uniref:Major facilitator superfamily (MFS) profile domain-containing protein n=1 Tax=Clastoptera arizonana TaxID=38151 RepID=A0A1B6E2A8_9HEMI
MLSIIFSTQYLAGFTALLSVIASAGCFGWMTPIMSYLRDPNNDIYMTSEQVAFMIAVLEVGETPSCIPTGILADKIGRKACILLSGPIYAVTWLVILFTTNYVIICAMRVLQGFAMALVFAVVPLYLGEISSPANRGSLTGLFSVAWFFGYLLQYCVGPYVSYFIFTLLTTMVPVVFTVVFIFQPESPHYLLSKNKLDKAEKALTWLRKGEPEELIRSELEEMNDTVQKELNSKPSWNDVIETPADRQSLFILFIIGTTRILSGAIAIMSYSTALFEQAGWSSFLSPDDLTIIMGVAFLIGGVINAAVVDSLGRRPVIFISCLGSALSLFIVGLYFFMKKSQVDVTAYSWTVPLGVIIYCIFSVVGLYPVSMTYTSELFTTKTRGMAAALSTMNLSIGGFLCIELYQLVGDNYGLEYVFWFFAIVCIVGCVVLYFVAPETKGKTFSQIRDEIINVKNKNKSPS